MEGRSKPVQAPLCSYICCMTRWLYKGILYNAAFISCYVLHCVVQIRRSTLNVSAASLLQNVVSICIRACCGSPVHP